MADCIERTTTGRPWLARTLWGLRDQEDGWPGAAVRNSNGTEDLGPLQVNSWWASRIETVINRDPAAVRRWLRDDACFNVDAARWIFCLRWLRRETIGRRSGPITARRVGGSGAMLCAFLRI
ncbi:MAG: murein transglycosylase [Bradyrhizobium sp.]|nr:murein transglycosylase [Bradyrhizobium sp.]